MFYGQREEKPCPLNFVMKASELLYQGYIGHWCYAIDTQSKEEKVEDIPVVTKIAPQREIDFEMELNLMPNQSLKPHIIWP